MRARVLDTSGLEPPQPMQQVLVALGELAADEYLVMQHRREPLPLYPLLARLGFCHRVRRGRTTTFEVVIWRATDPEPPCSP